MAAIVPWNFPLMIGMWKIAPALACGCTLVVKPAEITPLSRAARGRTGSRGGCAAGALNIVTRKGERGGRRARRHPGVDKVTFTGSPRVGRGILQGAAGNFKRVTLEFGGKSANMIFADANLDNAHVPQRPAFSSTPVRCARRARGFSRSDVYDEVVERLATRARRRFASVIPARAETTMGPLISANQMKTVLELHRYRQGEGASLVTGGARVGERGYFVEPTVFADVEHEMRISQEEIFGPVASVIPFDDEADAIRIANGTAYSLAAGYGAADIGRVHRMALS